MKQEVLVRNWNWLSDSVYSLSGDVKAFTMYLQCPACGNTGERDDFRFIGKSKIICNKCRSILQIAVICPNCNELNEIPDRKVLGIYPYHSIFGWFWKKMNKYPNFYGSCKFCHYRAPIEDFKPVVIFGELYSVINF